MFVCGGLCIVILVIMGGYVVRLRVVMALVIGRDSALTLLLLQDL